MALGGDAEIASVETFEIRSIANQDSISVDEEIFEL